MKHEKQNGLNDVTPFSCSFGGIEIAYRFLRLRGIETPSAVEAVLARKKFPRPYVGGQGQNERDAAEHVDL